MANDTPSHVEQVAAILRSGARPVAAFVFWTLAAINIGRAKLRERFESIGLGKAVGRDPRPEALLATAVKACSRGLPKAARGSGITFRRLGRYAFAILEERLGGGEVLLVEHTLTITLEQSGSVWEAVTKTASGHASSPALELSERVLDAYLHARDFVDSTELSSMITTALHGTLTSPMLAAVSLRERSGGLYLVPAQSVELARMLATVVREESSSSFHVLSLYADEENLRAACGVARESLAGRLNELRDEVSEFVAEQKAQDKDTGERNLKARLRRYDALRARVDVYADLLGEAKTDLVSGIENAKSELARVLGI